MGVVIRVTVKATGYAVKLLGGGQSGHTLELPRPMTVEAILSQLVGVDPVLFALVAVNGTRQRPEFLVESDAEILLMSPVAGG